MLSNFAITEKILRIVNFSVTNRYGMMSVMLLKCICHEVKNQHGFFLVTYIILQCRTVHLATTYTVFKTCSKLSCVWCVCLQMSSWFAQCCAFNLHACWWCQHSTARNWWSPCLQFQHNNWRCKPLYVFYHVQDGEVFLMVHLNVMMQLFGYGHVILSLWAIWTTQKYLYLLYKTNKGF